MSELRTEIRQAIKNFATGKPLDCGRKLLNALGYQSNNTETIAPNNWAGFKAQFVDGSRPFIEGNARLKEAEHSELKGNMRDYATLEQLVVLSNLESLNAELIKMGLPAEERLQKLNRTAIEQMKVMVSNRSLKALQQGENNRLKNDSIDLKREIDDNP